MRLAPFIAALLLLPACSSRVDGPPGGMPSGGRMPLSLLGEPLGRMAPDEDAYAGIVLDWAQGLDADHDGFLSPEEAKPEIARFFAAVDADRDGSINARELGDYRIARLSAPRGPRPDGPPPPEGGGRPAGPGGARGGGGGMTGGGEDKVMAADRNLDFRVTPEELAALVRERLRALDADHDGRVSLTEIRGWAAAAYRERPTRGGPGGGRRRDGGGPPGGGGGPPGGGRG